jgi:hypothetical protein
MKKNIFVVLCIITCAATFTACGPSKSGNRTKSEITEVDSSTLSKEEPVQQKIDSVQLQNQVIIFTPAAISVNKPKNNLNNVLGESESPAHTYEATIYFLDSIGNAYTIYFWEVAYKENGKTNIEDEKRIKETMDVFTIITNCKTEELTLRYQNENLSVYRKVKVTNEKIGNATVIEEIPDPLWSGRCKKESMPNDVNRAPFLIHAGTEGVTNASNSNE